MIYNLNSGHLLMWICRGLEIIGYYYILSYSPYRLFENLPVWQTFLIAFIAWDLVSTGSIEHITNLVHCGYYNVHHQGENFNLSLGLEMLGFITTALPFYAILAIAGLPVEMFIQLQVFILSFNSITTIALSKSQVYLSYL